MMSPRLTADGETGSTITSAPLLMAGSIELPVTTKVPMPSVRIARSPRQLAKSTTASAIEQMCPIFLTVVLLLSALAGCARELRRRVGDGEVLREALERVAGRRRKAEDEGQVVAARRGDGPGGRDGHVLQSARVHAVRRGRAVVASVDRGLKPVGRVRPEKGARGRADRAGVREAGVAAVRNVHDALRRVTGHEVR